MSPWKKCDLKEIIVHGKTPWFTGTRMGEFSAGLAS
jgi:hypothetical protein